MSIDEFTQLLSELEVLDFNRACALGELVNDNGYGSLFLRIKGKDKVISVQSENGVLKSILYPLQSEGLDFSTLESGFNKVNTHYNHHDDENVSVFSVGGNPVFEAFEREGKVLRIKYFNY